MTQPLNLLRFALFSTLLSIISIALLPSIGHAQPEEDEDSIRTYRLGEVVVTDETMKEVTPTTVQRLGYGTIARTDATTAADVAYQIPAARIQTNSRGEALLYLRGAGERQVAIFLDGALLNVPWDNRVDLSLVPIAAVGGITVSKGVPSVLYGANVIGGAVNMVSQELNTPGMLGEAILQGGQHEFLSGSATGMYAGHSFNAIASFGYTSRAGLPIPGGVDLPFNQPAGDLRLNTDLESFNLYLRGEYLFPGASRLGLSVNSIFGEKGVAPEGHIEEARFWRYPAWRNTTITLNGTTEIGPNNEWTLRGAIWGTRFSQLIGQYESAAYSTLTARQEDLDLTLGGRLTLSHQFETGSIALAINSLQSGHDQTDYSFDSVGAAVAAPLQVYQQQLYSIGLEYNGRFADDLLGLVLGVSYDGMQTPKTGDKPGQEPFGEYSAMAGATYQLRPDLLLRASVGRKTRFPTMRELYGEALRRFLINPDLKAEEALLGELGIEGSFLGWGAFTLTGFGNRTSNTIDQRNLDTLGGRRRQRINLPGSRVIGAELTANVTAIRPFRLDGHLTVMSARGIAENDSTFFLSEKPDLIATVTAGYDFPFDLQASAEMVYTGTAYSLNDENVFVPLDPSLALNLRLGYRFVIGESAVMQLFVRANNITDARVMPQLGLPGTGREIQGGIKVNL